MFEISMNQGCYARIHTRTYREINISSSVYPFFEVMEDIEKLRYFDFSDRDCKR